MESLAWIFFIILICILLFYDLRSFKNNEHEISTKEALSKTLFWIVIALIFNVIVYFLYEYDVSNLRSHSHDIISGKDAAIKFFTGYIIEKALSLDNIFVISLLFTYFHIPNKYQHRVLFWGILGALIFRGIMIIVGAALVHKFSFIMYVFGAFLIFSALKMLFAKEQEFNPENNKIISLIKRIYPISPQLDNEYFFTVHQGVKMATPLFVALIIIELSDIMFAIDSIPAIFVVTTDSFIVFSSNIFAILGLRAMYFVLASFIEKFVYLKYSLTVLLMFIGLKMLFMQVYQLPILASLFIIIGILAVGTIASIIKMKKYK